MKQRATEIFYIQIYNIIFNYIFLFGKIKMENSIKLIRRTQSWPLMLSTCLRATDWLGEQTIDIDETKVYTLSSL